MTPEIIQFLTDSIQAVMEVQARSDAEYLLLVRQLWLQAITAIIVAFIGVAGPIFLYRQHKQFNHRMDELRVLWEEKAAAKAVAEERKN